MHRESETGQQNILGKYLANRRIKEERVKQTIAFHTQKPQCDFDGAMSHPRHSMGKQTGEGRG